MQGESLPEGRSTTRGYRKQLKRLARLLGDSRQAARETTSLLESLKDKASPEALERYVDLVKAADGKGAGELRSVFLALEEKGSPETYDSFKRLQETLELAPADTYAYLGWLETTFPSGKPRLEALALSQGLRGLPQATMRHCVEGLSGLPQPRERLEELEALSRLGLSAQEALEDLKSVRGSAIGFRVLEKIRRELPEDHETVRQATATILEEPDQRGRREAAFHKLLRVEGDARAAAADLEWLLKGDSELESATDEFVRLLGQTSGGNREEVRAAFGAVRALEAEPQGWLARLGWGTTKEEAFRDLTELHGSPRIALQDLELLTSSPKDLGESFKLLKSLYLLDEADSLSASRQAFELVQREGPAFPSSSERLKVVRTIARDLSSLEQANRVFQAATQGSDTGEAEARLRLFYSWLDRQVDQGQAVQLLAGAAAAFDRGVPVERLTPLFEDALEKNRAGFFGQAAEAAARASEAGGDFMELLGVFTASGNESAMRGVTELLSQGNGRARLTMLGWLKEAYKGRLDLATEDAAILTKHFPDDRLPVVARSYARLVSVLGPDRAREARALLSWAADTAEQKKYQRLGAERLLDELVTVYIVSPDAETAHRTVLQNVEPEAGLYDAEDYIIVGDFVVDKNVN